MIKNKPGAKGGRKTVPCAKSEKKPEAKSEMKKPEANGEMKKPEANWEMMAYTDFMATLSVNERHLWASGHTAEDQRKHFADQRKHFADQCQ